MHIRFITRWVYYSYPEIHRRLGIAGSIMAQLDNVWRQQRLSVSTKLRIYTSLVQSVVLYGSETWTMRKVDSERIQSFHMQTLRRILGIRWYEKVSNAEVNERTKLPLSVIADRRHSLFGHICRLPENTAASQALQLSIEAHTGTPPAADWKRPPGRPRRNWLQQVEEDTGLSLGAARIAGQDRSMWRTLRPSAGQSQQGVSEYRCRVLSLSDCKYSLNPLSQTQIDWVGRNRIRWTFKLSYAWHVWYSLGVLLRIKYLLTNN